MNSPRIRDDEREELRRDDDMELPNTGSDAFQVEVQAADGTIVTINEAKKEEEVLVTLVSLSDPLTLREFYQYSDDLSEHLQPLDGKSDPTEKLSILALQRGKHDKLAEGKFNSSYKYSRFNWGFWLNDRTPSATLNFKGPFYVRYRIIELKKLKLNHCIDHGTLRTVDEVCQNMSYKRYCYRSGSSTFCPVWKDQNPLYCAEQEAKNRHGKPDIHRAQMEVDHTALEKGILDPFLRNHWICKPLWGDELDFTRVILAHSWPCKPDILRWHRLCHRMYENNKLMEDSSGWLRAIDVSKIYWNKFCQTTMDYYMNPSNISDRRLARSRDEVYYVDRATVLIWKRTTAHNLTYDNFPMAQVLRLEKKHKNMWWAHPKFSIQMLLNRESQNSNIFC